MIECSYHFRSFVLHFYYIYQHVVVLKKTLIYVNKPRFVSALEIWGFPVVGDYKTYSGGGYLADFYVNRNISDGLVRELFNTKWIDRHTRAVFLEFTVYCPSTQLFVYSVFCFEFPATGGIIKSYSIYPFRVFMHTDNVGLFTLICEIVFLVLLLILLGKICFQVFQERSSYFRHFWSGVDIVTLCLGVASVVLYFLRYHIAMDSVSRFKKNVQYFVNFAHVVYLDRLLSTTIAILAFVVTLKFLLILQDLKNVRAITRIFKRCGKDIVWNGAAFGTVLVGFAFLSTLSFGSQIASYKHMLNSLSTLFIAIIGKSKYTEINELYPVFAEVFFALFITASVFFFMTIFMSILGAAIDEVIHHTRRDKRQDIVNYTITWFKNILVAPVVQKISTGNLKVMGKDRTVRTKHWSIAQQSKLNII